MQTDQVMVRDPNRHDPLIVTMLLDSAVANKFLSFAGKFVGIINASSQSANVLVRLNDAQSTPVPLTQGLYLSVPSAFRGIWFDYTAQAGEWITLIVSDDQNFHVQDNRSNTLQATYLSAISTNSTKISLLAKLNAMVDAGTATRFNTSNIANDASVTLKTVGGTGCYITSAYFSYNSSNGTRGLIKVCDGAGDEQYRIAQSAIGINNQHGSISRDFPHPIFLPVGHTVKLVSEASGVYVAGGINTIDLA